MNIQVCIPTLVFVFLVMSASTTVVAQNHDHETPYAEITGREIKALSSDEVNGLLHGDGLGMALPAELNGFPGPRHVLDMGDDLGLTESQRKSVQEIFNDMHVRAAEIGSEIVEKERILDQLFAASQITSALLEGSVLEIAGLRGQLRFVHLRAHLQMIDVLSEFQKRHYQMLRGYGEHDH